MGMAGGFLQLLFVDIFQGIAQGEITAHVICLKSNFSKPCGNGILKSKRDFRKVSARIIFLLPIPDTREKIVWRS